MESILNLYGIPFQKTQSHVIASKSEAKYRTVPGEAISFGIAASPSAPRNDKNKSFVHLTNLPGQAIWKKYPEYFDRTLVDVPCSMEGRIRLDDPETYKDWKLGKIKGLERTQQYLLRSAISATKVGGTIVYSTCTLAPEENEGVIDWILKKNGAAIEIEKIEIPNLQLQPMLTHWGNKQYTSLTLAPRSFSEVGARIQPSAQMEGFFIAKIRKLSSTI